MEASGKIVIYGAGAYAGRLYISLRFNGKEQEIKAFVVSGSTSDAKEKYGKPIVAYRDAEDIIRDSVVYIAVAEKHASGIRERVERYKPQEIISITDKHYDDLLNDIYSAAARMPIRDNQIFVDNYFGMGYRCNCKYIVGYLLEHGYPVEIAWDVTNDPDAELPEGIKGVISGTPEYYELLYSSRIYLTNCGPRSFYDKRSEQYMIDTWHGTGPFKKAGMSVNDMSEEEKEGLRHQFSQIDLFISNSKDNTEMYRDSFEFKKEIMECGYPRNDFFFNEAARTEVDRRVRNKLGLSKNRKILLYVPTFRDVKKASLNKYDLGMRAVLDSLENRFREKFQLLYRFHHALYQYDEYRGFYDDAIDVTLYEDIQELLVVADVLITDYSSVMWDFSLMRKPVFLYHNDADEYENDRGFYWPPSEWPYPKAHTSEEMCRIIEQFDDDDYQKKLDEFFTKDPSYDDGHASERVAERIMDVIEHPDKYMTA